MTCDECGRPSAVHLTPSGRHLCDDCHRDLTFLAAAGSTFVGGVDVVESVATGFASRAYAGTADAEVEAIRARRAKLAATTGFWRRLWVRVVG